MSLRFWPLVVVGALALAACDSAPGLPESPGRAPLLSGLAITPDAFARETLDPGVIDGDTARVSVELTVRVHDPDDAITGVQAIVTRATAGLGLLATVPLAAQEGDVYGARFSLPLPLGEPGTYTVVVLARDAAGGVGQMVGRVTYTTPTDPPAIEAVAATPDPFPSTGGRLTLTATVSDPQGLEDLVRVEVQTADGQTFRLFDDGQSFGDVTADDGVFTASIVLVFDEPVTGTLPFTFRAIDRAGLRSEEVELILTVQ